MRPPFSLGYLLAAVLVAPLHPVAVRAQAPATLVLPKAAPTIDQILSLKRAGSPQISPDGRWAAYTVRQTNWDENAYDTQIWLVDTHNGATRQLTNSRKSSNAPA